MTHPSTYRLAAAVVLSGLLWGAAVSAPPVVTFPTAPPPAIPPAAKAADLATLPPGFLYVFTSDAPVVVLASPPEVVRVEEEAGPIRVYGRFVGGTGDEETKRYGAKQVFVVRGLAAGKVELIIVPKDGLKSRDDVIVKGLDVTGALAPRPPPVEPPTPKTDPPVVPPKTAGEIPAPGLHVMILYDPNDPIPPKQQSVLDGKAARDWLEANCVVGPNGVTRQYRIWPAAAAGANDSKLWGDAQRLRGSAPLPWLLVSNGTKGGYKGQLPADPEAFLKLVEKYR